MREATAAPNDSKNDFFTDMRFRMFVAATILSAIFGFETLAQSVELGEMPSVVPIEVGRDSGKRRDERPDPAQIEDNGQQPNSYLRPRAKVRFKRYLNDIAGPFALGRDVAVAGISTWANSPEEWGKKWDGFGRRVASNFGKNVIKQTAIYGLDEALKIDSHYYRSRKKDAGSKIRNALLSPVTARNASGKRVIGIPRIVGTYASSIIATEAWYPARYDYKEGLRSGTISLGINAAFGLIKEFVWKR